MPILKNISFNKKGVILSIIAIIVYLSVPLYNNLSTRYLNDSIKESVLTYATLRSMNGALSVIKNSSVGVDVGVDAKIALGEVVSPIKDAIERFSDLITTSIWTLGSEKILYEISKTSLIIVTLLIVCLLCIFTENQAIQKFLILLIIFRLFIPFSALFSNYFNQEIFQPKFKKDHAVLIHSIQHSKTHATIQKNIKKSWWHKTEADVHSTLKAASNFKHNMEYYKNNSEKITSAIVNLAVLFFTKLIVNILLLPLLLFYIAKSIYLQYETRAQ